MPVRSEPGLRFRKASHNLATMGTAASASNSGACYLKKILVSVSFVRNRFIKSRLVSKKLDTHLLVAPVLDMQAMDRERTIPALSASILCTSPGVYASVQADRAVRVKMQKEIAIAICCLAERHLASVGATAELAEAMRTLGAVNAVPAAAPRAAVPLPLGDAPPRGRTRDHEPPEPCPEGLVGHASAGASASVGAAAAPADQGEAGQGGPAGGPAASEGGRAAAVGAGAAIAGAAVGWRISLVAEGVFLARGFQAFRVLGRCSCSAGYMMC